MEYKLNDSFYYVFYGRHLKVIAIDSVSHNITLQIGEPFTKDSIVIWNERLIDDMLYNGVLIK